MAAEDGAGTRYAVVVPDEALPKAQRVPAWVRARLRVDLYAVDENNAVSKLLEPASSSGDSGVVLS